MLIVVDVLFNSMPSHAVELRIHKKKSEWQIIVISHFKYYMHIKCHAGVANILSYSSTH